MPDRSLGQAVIAISSHVARGSVGNRASVFALEALSCPVWSVPTVILPWHPGHGPSTRIVPGRKEFADFVKDIANAGWIAEVGAILSGYMAAPWQVEEVVGLVKHLKNSNNEVVYLCDPVIGDEAGLYIPEETANSIREKLVPLCDITTPNRHELAWLNAAEPAQSVSQAIEQARKLACMSVLVTSAPGSHKDLTGNLLVSGGNAWLVEHPAIKNPPNGPGDLTAAIFLARHIAGSAEKQNLARTTASVLEIVQRSRELGVDELPLESSIHAITDPDRDLAVVEF